jgi:hypothetical protein
MRSKTHCVSYGKNMQYSTMSLHWLIFKIIVIPFPQLKLCLQNLFSGYLSFIVSIQADELDTFLNTDVIDVLH